MTFNEWFLDQDEDVQAALDVDQLRAAWEMLEEDGVDGERIALVFDGLLSAWL